MEIKTVKNSAMGTASHKPSTPMSFGSVNSPMIIKPKVRKNEMAADTLPLEKAVNMEEAYRFVPENK